MPGRSCRPASAACCPAARARRRPGTAPGPAASTAWPRRPGSRSGWSSPRSRSSAARSRRCSSASAARPPACPRPRSPRPGRARPTSRPACTNVGARSQPPAMPCSSSQSAMASSRSEASSGDSDRRLRHPLGRLLLQPDQRLQRGPVPLARPRSCPACAASRRPARAATRWPGPPPRPGCSARGSGRPTASRAPAAAPAGRSPPGRSCCRRTAPPAGAPPSGTSRSSARRSPRRPARRTATARSTRTELL